MENGRTVRLLGIAIAVMALLLVAVCVVGGYFVSNQLTTDTRPCKEQVKEFRGNMYIVSTLQASAAEVGDEGNYESALLNAKKAEEMIKDISPPKCSTAAVSVHTHFKRSITLYRQSLDARIDGRYEDANALEDETIIETRLATDALAQMLDEQ